MAIKIGPVIGVEGEKAFRAAFQDMIAQAKLFDNEMNKLTATFTKNDSALERNKRIQEQLTKQISNQRDVIEGHRHMLERAQSTQQKRTEAYEKQKKVVEELTQKYGEENKEVKEAKKDLESKEAAMYRSEKVTKTWQMRLNDAEVELHNLIQRLKDLPNSLQVVGDAMQEQGQKIADFGDKLTRYVTTPLAGLGVASIKAASDFRDGMAKVYTIADETKVSMEDMAEGLKTLSNETGFGLDDLAEAAYQAVSASVATEDALGFLTEATKLARAGFTDVTTSVDILSTVMNSYGKNTYTAAQISDILLKTQNDGKTIVNDLAQRMGLIIPMAKNYGVSLEQIAAGYATMTKQGVKTEQATTYFRAMFTQLEKEGSDVDEVLTSLTDRTFKQLMDSGYTISDVLKILWEYVDRDSEAFQRLFGQVRATQAVAALTADNFAVLDKELGAMANTTGLVDEALETLQTPGLQARKTLNRLKNTMVEIGETLMVEFMPIFEDVVDAIKRGTEWFANLDEGTQRTIVNIGLMVAALGPGLKIVGNVEKVLGKGISTLGKITKAMAGLPSPIKMIVAETEGATATSKGLFGLLELNGTTIAGLAAAYVAVAAGAKLMQDQYLSNIEATYGLTQGQKELIASSHELTTAWEETTAANSEQLSAVQRNNVDVQFLIDKYNSLVDSTGKVSDQNKVMADIILNELAEALGMERSDIDKLIEKNGMLGESIDAVVQKQMQQAYINVYLDDYQQALNSINELQKKHVELTQQETEKKQILAEAEIARNKEIDRLNTALETNAIDQQTYNKELNDAIQAYSYAKVAYDETEAQLRENDATMQETMATISNFEELQKSTTGTAEEFNLALLKQQEGFQTVETGTRESLYQQYRTFKETYENMKSEFDSGSTYITEEQLKAWEQLLSDSENELAKWESVNKTKAAQAAEANAKGWAEKSPRILAEVELTVDRSLNKLGKGSQSAFGKGQDFAKGYADGISAGIDGVGSAVQRMVNRALEITQQTQKSGSPSKITTEFGKEFGQGYAIGIKSTADLAREASAYLATNAIDTGAMINGYSPNRNGDYYSNTKTISAPISVNVNVTGNVNDYNALARAVSDEISREVLRKGAVFK